MDGFRTEEQDNVRQITSNNAKQPSQQWLGARHRATHRIFYLKNISPIKWFSSVLVVVHHGKLYSGCDRVDVPEACPELAEGPVLSKVEGN